MKRIFIFIPGYYGTTLVEEESNQLLWPSARDVLFGKKTLALKIPDIPIPGTMNLRAEKLVEKVNIVGPFYKEEAYEKSILLLRKLCRHHHDKVHTLPWDWRMDPIHAIRKLHNLVEEIKEEHKQSNQLCEINIISHSFGSLIAAYYLRYGDQDYFSAKENWHGLRSVQKVILAAAPYRGLMAMFRNMHKGLQMGLNDQLQSALAFCSFESSYYLLPPSGMDLVFDTNFQEHSLNLHDVNNWKKHRWGFFSEKINLPKSNLLAFETFTDLHLQRSRKLIELMDAPIQNNEITEEPAAQILYIQGTGRATVDKGIWLPHSTDKNNLLYYPLEVKKQFPRLPLSKLTTDGDLTVPSFSSRLPDAFEPFVVKKIISKYEHLQLLQHATAQAQIKDFLSN